MHWDFQQASLTSKPLPSSPQLCGFRLCFLKSFISNHWSTLSSALTTSPSCLLHKTYNPKINKERGCDRTQVAHSSSQLEPLFVLLPLLSGCIAAGVSVLCGGDAGSSRAHPVAALMMGSCPCSSSCLPWPGGCDWPGRSCWPLSCGAPARSPCSGPAPLLHPQHLLACQL